MAVTIVERPLGFILSDTPNGADIFNSTGTAALSTGGLSDGDYIYLVTNVQEYNGFFYLNEIGTDVYSLRRYPTGPDIEFIVAQDDVVDGSVFYKAQTQHKWNCVHLPIVYGIESDKWPVNSVDDGSVLVGSFTDDNGYVNLNLSAALKTTVFNLDYVKISGSPDSNINGVWQIVNAVGNSDVSIDMSYDSGLSLVGATVQFYYNNYNVKVRIYAGIPPNHQFETLKPTELLTEISMIPDAENLCRFSVSDIIRSKISIRNKLLLGTLPNNIDAWTSFYITVAESYDISDGTDISAYSSIFGVAPLFAFVNLGNGDPLWTTGEHPTNTIPSLGQTDIIYGVGDLEVGVSYSFDYSVTSAHAYDIYMFFMDASFGSIDFDTISSGGGGTDIGIISLTPTIKPSYVGIRIANTFAGANAVTLNYFVKQGDNTNDETFTGYASNSKLPFKNVYSGSLSEYVLNQYMPAKFLTGFSQPVLFEGHYFDISFITDNTFTNLSLKQQYYFNGILHSTVTKSISSYDEGLYRVTVDEPGDNSNRVDITVLSGATVISEVKTIKIDSVCSAQDIYLTWLNGVGGFDYWLFKDQKDNIIQIDGATQTKENILPAWPMSYGAFANTINKEVLRESSQQLLFRASGLSLAESQGLELIKTSILVQILVSRFDLRTLVLDTDSFTSRKDGAINALYKLQFSGTYTDNIPVQSL